MQVKREGWIFEEMGVEIDIFAGLPPEPDRYADRGGLLIDLGQTPAKMAKAQQECHDRDP
jgi:hypothetical protein